MEYDFLQTLWIGEINELIYYCLSSFIKKGHPIHLYCYTPPKNLPDGIIIRSAESIIPREKIIQNSLGVGKGSFAAFSDLFRFELLNRVGGWWIDADIYCIKPFVFSSDYVFASEEDSLGSCVIKAPKASPPIQKTLEKISKVDFDSVKWTEFKDIFENQVLKSEYNQYIMPSNIFCPIPWKNIKYIVETNQPIDLDSATFGIHLWNEIWRRNKMYGKTKNIIKKLSALEEKI